MRVECVWIVGVRVALLRVFGACPRVARAVLLVFRALCVFVAFVVVLCSR